MATIMWGPTKYHACHTDDFYHTDTAQRVKWGTVYFWGIHCSKLLGCTCSKLYLGAHVVKYWGTHAIQCSLNMQKHAVNYWGTLGAHAVKYRAVTVV